MVAVLWGFLGSVFVVGFGVGFGLVSGVLVGGLSIVVCGGWRFWALVLLVGRMFCSVRWGHGSFCVSCGFCGDAYFVLWSWLGDGLELCVFRVLVLGACCEVDG